MQLIKILDVCFTTVIVVDEDDRKQPRSGPISICQVQLEPPDLQQNKSGRGILSLEFHILLSAVGQAVVRRSLIILFILLIIKLGLISSLLSIV